MSRASQGEGLRAAGQEWGGGILRYSEEGTNGLEFYSVLEWEGVEEVSQIILWVFQKAVVALAVVWGFFFFLGGGRFAGSGVRSLASTERQKMSSISGGNHFGSLALKRSGQLLSALHVQSSSPSLLRILLEADKRGGLKPAQAGRQGLKEGRSFFSVID